MIRLLNKVDENFDLGENKTFNVWVHGSEVCINVESTSGNIAQVAMTPDQAMAISWAVAQAAYRAAREEFAIDRETAKFDVGSLKEALSEISGLLSQGTEEKTKRAAQIAGYFARET